MPVLRWCRAATSSPVNISGGAAAAPFLAVYGCTVGTVLARIRTIEVSGWIANEELASVGYATALLRRYSTRPNGAAAENLVQVRLDSMTGLPTLSLCAVYDLVPVTGTAVGALGTRRVLQENDVVSATADRPAAIARWDFPAGVLLRSQREGIGVEIAEQGIAGDFTVAVSATITWTEETC